LKPLGREGGGFLDQPGRIVQGVACVLECALK
jgi:hypothetical protein